MENNDVHITLYIELFYTLNIRTGTAAPGESIKETALQDQLAFHVETTLRNQARWTLFVWKPSEAWQSMAVLGKLVADPRLERNWNILQERLVLRYPYTILQVG